MRTITQAWLMLAAVGCGTYSSGRPTPGGGGGDMAPAAGGGGGDDGGRGGGGGGGSDGGGDGGPGDGTCEVAFAFVPPAGQSVATVQARGEWDGFASPGVPLQPDGAGAYRGHLRLPPGLTAYKLVVDGQWQLDPAARLRKYVGDTENSAVRVADCHAPSLTLVHKTLTRPAAGQGRFAATVAFAARVEGDLIDGESVRVTLRHDGVDTPLQASVDAAAQQIALETPPLADGKYTIFVAARDGAGTAAPPLRLVFWSEAEPFDWQDALLYMVMTDRFADGDPHDDPPPTAGVDARADFRGGDLAGVRDAIAAGTFDRLGVTALWLSPFPRNPAGPSLADDGVHQVMGYHGYWPIAAREVEPRIGGAAALDALVHEAHAHGIRVLADFVINHVHQEHEYARQHPSWFRTGCICGQQGCDWTEHRLDCQFADYLPDVNWTVPEVVAQWSEDAVWWLDRFDLDGLRLDAVKHVEDIAVINLSARIRDEFEAAGTRLFLTGETAMGWNDCGLGCNAGQYGTIARYLGPDGLDGQADFVLYHAVPYRVFSSDQHGMIHADYWTRQSQLQYPAGAIMTPYLGSHDTPRFVTLASYRGQDSAHDPSVPFDKWDHIAGAPPDAEPYQRLRLGLTWLLTLPGAPLLYYGDEYGEWGGADPNNRVLWRGAGALSTEEQATLERTRALGTARRALPALRRGRYVSFPVESEDVLLFAREGGPGQVAIVALTRAAGGAHVDAAQLPDGLGLGDGAVLHDRLGGPDVTVARRDDGTLGISLSLLGRGAAILAP